MYLDWGDLFCLPRGDIIHWVDGDGARGGFYILCNLNCDGRVDVHVNQLDGEVLRVGPGYID